MMANQARTSTSPVPSVKRGSKSPRLVGAHEQRIAQERRLMPNRRPPGARIAVLVADIPTGQMVNRWLTDPLNTLIRLESPAELDDLETSPDVVVVGRALLSHGAVTLRHIRQRWLTASLLVIGAHDDFDVERLLDGGADDAVRAGSPLLASRLRAAARRARTVSAGTRIAIGDLVYDRESRRVYCAGTRVRLTRTEETLLDCFFWYMPRTVTFAEITSFVWGGEVTTERRNLLHVYVGYLRRKLAASRQVRIRTVRGVGYELVATEAEAEGDVPKEAKRVGR